MKEYKCPYCGFSSIEHQGLLDHLWTYHFSKPWFIEERDQETIQGVPLTLLDQSEFSYLLPDWSQITKKFDKDQALLQVQNSLHDFYGRVLGDRYFQLFIIDDIYLRTTLTHSYGEFKEVLRELKGGKDRNKIWFIDFKPGFPKTICHENLDGLKIVGIEGKYNVVSDKDNLQVNNYTIKKPEYISSDQRHHGKYNILNKTGDSKSKRLKLGKDCIKFYPGNAIFQIENPSGEPIDPSTIPSLDLLILKLVLLRNKSYTRVMMEILEELSSSCGLLRDGIFLKNTINTNPWKKGTDLSLTWLHEENPDFINISVW